MKYLITGITGFAGPNLAKLLLEKGHDVHGVVRNPNGREMDLLDMLSVNELNSIHFHYMDLRDTAKVQSFFLNNKFDGIFHLAAMSHPPTSFKDPVMTFQDNVLASVNIITAIENTDTKLHFCSTSEVYGDTCKDKGILTVEDNLAPANPYGASKAAIDIYMQERMRNKLINGFVTRAFSHTGIRRGHNFSISSDAFQIAKIIFGMQDRVLAVGNLATERVVIDVRDCVNAYYLLMVTPESTGNVYNVCGDNVHKMGFFTERLIEIAGFNKNDIVLAVDSKLYRPIDIQVQKGDCTSLKELTGWQANIPIEETLRSLLDYWKNKIRPI